MMKKLLVTLAVIASLSSFAQSEENLKQIQFINAERPLEAWFSTRGQYLSINFKDSDASVQIPIAQAIYEMKYEFSQGDGQNLWFLHITCRDGAECVSPTGWKEIVIAISEHHERADNILKGLKALK